MDGRKELHMGGCETRYPRAEHTGVGMMLQSAHLLCSSGYGSRDRRAEHLREAVSN